MPGKTLDGWEFVERFGGYLIYVWQDPRAKQWTWGLVRMPETGSIAGAAPWEDVGDDYESREAALDAARKEIVLRNQQRTGGGKS